VGAKQAKPTGKCLNCDDRLSRGRRLYCSRRCSSAYLARKHQARRTAYHRAYLARNPGKIKAIALRFRKKNRARLAEKSREYHKKHRDTCVARMREYYAANRETLLRQKRETYDPAGQAAKNKAYRAANLEKLKRLQAEYHERNKAKRNAKCRVYHYRMKTLKLELGIGQVASHLEMLHERFEGG
jgi:hypothetical protein